MVNDTAAQTRLALVTGATGYVGSNLVTELLDRGWRVRTLSRRGPEPEMLGDAAKCSHRSRGITLSG